jgi:hypothetical protein
MEAMATAVNKKQSGRQFRKEHRYVDLINAVRRQGDIFAGAFDNDPDMDAECGLWCGEAP